MTIEEWCAKATSVLNQLPDGHWLFVADGAIHVMRYGTGGHIELVVDGVNEDYVVASLDLAIHVDGGDW